MYQEPSSIETAKKPEAQENHEAPRGIESSEELREKMTSESEKETVNFKKESADDLLRAEARAEKDGLSLDGEDKDELQGLSREADAAKAELLSEIAPPPLPDKYFTTPPPLPNQEGRGIPPPPLPDSYEYAPPPLPNEPPPLPKLTPPPLPIQESGVVALPLPTEHYVTPPPLPDGYQYAPPPLPNGPPPLPFRYESESPPLPEEGNGEPALPTAEGKEPEYGSVEYYLQKSKLADRDEALGKLMAFAGVSTEKELRNKLKEKDEDRRNVIEIDRDIPTTILEYEENPSIDLLTKARSVGNALGYTFANTPGYESQVDDLIGRLKGAGKKEDAIAVEKIFEEDRRESERERAKSEFPEIDPKLSSMNEDEKKQYVDKLKNLPPDEIVHLYHGINGSYKTAQAILDSPSHGIQQRSGPTFSFVPVGQFWKKGGLGFRYAIRRDQIEFPGEENLNAVVRIAETNDTGVVCNESKRLPLTEFDAEIVRSVGTYPNFDAEKEIKEKLRNFSDVRKAKKPDHENQGAF